MSRSSDEPNFGEVKGLLTRLEKTALSGPDSTPSQQYASRSGEPASHPRAPHGLSSTAVLLLIANTAMATATITSIAWYFFHVATMQKDGPVAGVLNDRGAPPTMASVGENVAAFTEALPHTGPLRPDPVRPPSKVGALPTTQNDARLTPADADPPASEEPPRSGTGAEPFNVPETLHVRASETARVPIELPPRSAEPAIKLLSIRGLPDDVTLNLGSKSGPHLWTVPAGEWSELELIAASGARTDRFDLVIAARSENGQVLASGRSTLIVTGTLGATGTLGSALKEPPSVSLDAAAQSAYLAKARELLGIGQVAAARLVLQRAADAGNAEAALSLGDTYDPLRLFEMGTRGIVGDLKKATFWYEKADELGSPEAKARIIGLEHD